MRGIPKALKTRADYERARDLAIDGTIPHADRQRALRHWQALLGGRWRWDFDRELDSEGDVAEGDDYRVRQETDEETGDATRIVQEVRSEDANARIFRIDLTVPEVEQTIHDMEAAING